MDGRVRGGVCIPAEARARLHLARKLPVVRRVGRCASLCLHRAAPLARRGATGVYGASERKRLGGQRPDDRADASQAYGRAQRHAAWSGSPTLWRLTPRDRDAGPAARGRARCCRDRRAPAPAGPPATDPCALRVDAPGARGRRLLLCRRQALRHQEELSAQHAARAAARFRAARGSRAGDNTVQPAVGWRAARPAPPSHPAARLRYRHGGRRGRLSRPARLL
mmetsp:Transcript_13110/g.42979  ORF Transcript_13110/g.42979 Transcript_13110/m.42979 type:complete len:223 (+) Transcript_13110:195-863(+)